MNIYTDLHGQQFNLEDTPEHPPYDYHIQDKAIEGERHRQTYGHLYFQDGISYLHIYNGLGPDKELSWEMGKAILEADKQNRFFILL